MRKAHCGGFSKASEGSKRRKDEEFDKNSQRLLER